MSETGQIPGQAQARQRLRVAYLGPDESTYTGTVAKRKFANAERIPIRPISMVIHAVENGRADYAVVPLENFYKGKVMETLDALCLCNRTVIVEEVHTHIQHCIGALKGHGVIRRILSKNEALDQCGAYILENYPDVETEGASSTSDAVRKIIAGSWMDAAAIAGEDAFHNDKIEIMAHDILPNNITRFAILSQASTSPTGDDKTMISLYPTGRDKPGALVDCLIGFRDRRINLEGLTERPDGKGGYRFYFEANGHALDPEVAAAIRDAGFTRVLGSYRNSHWKETRA